MNNFCLFLGGAGSALVALQIISVLIGDPLPDFVGTIALIFAGVAVLVLIFEAGRHAAKVEKLRERKS